MKNLLRIVGIALIAIAFSFTNHPKKTLILDVGHGGIDTGATVNGISEKEIVLSIAKRIKELSKDSNIDVILTRDSDAYPTLRERSEEMNTTKADYVISLHVNNSKDHKKSGKEIYIYEKSTKYQESKTLATLLLEGFDKKNIEIKHKNLHLLREVKHPIALIELGYLSNKEDRDELISEKGQIEIAERILKSIQ